MVCWQAWEEIKIEEEGEEGRKVESMIRLPMQVSASSVCVKCVRACVR